MDGSVISNCTKSHKMFAYFFGVNLITVEEKILSYLNTTWNFTKTLPNYQNCGLVTYIISLN